MPLAGGLAGVAVALRSLSWTLAGTAVNATDPEASRSGSTTASQLSQRSTGGG